MKRFEQVVYALDQAIVDDLFVLEGFDLELPVDSLLVDLVLLGANKRALVDVWVDFNIRIVGQLQGVLELGFRWSAMAGGVEAYPFAVIDGHSGLDMDKGIKDGRRGSSLQGAKYWKERNKKANSCAGSNANNRLVGRLAVEAVGKRM